MDERRNIERRELVSLLRVLDLETGELLGYLADVTTDGLMLYSEAPITVGKLYSLEIRMQNLEAAMFYEDGRDKRIRFQGESRWCSGEANPPLYSTGFLLTDVSPAALISISYMIRKLGKGGRLARRERV
ncbi:MAG: hypothetical protein GY862_10020 [Gammaproteobacteria bacterium]|nr:hypothetical protein [Gammaproteobacteria bacterium]